MRQRAVRARANNIVTAGSERREDATSHASPLSAREAALGYLSRGWSVIPIEHRAKRPLVAWLEFQSRCASAREVDGWFARWPEANVGIVTGRISALVVIDVDAGHGGEPSIARLESGHGPLPATLEALTGGGGRHLYFAYPGGRVGNRVGLFPGVDLRGDGGCVVAPPSLHPSGRRYAWARARSPDEAQLAPLPAWLLHESGAKRAGHSPEHWRRLVREGVAEGERNATLASLAGHLLRHEVDPEVVMELLLAWNRARCRPPLADAEVAGVVESITRLHHDE
ncbi:MAG TPA: bifunctional DNA primase/polymerase [Burkholderiales bacterium]|nr:bifunctional DNA primase/polymerase [Burkholderiales bacterium]